MKVFLFCIFLVLTCVLHLTNAIHETPRRVESIHRRITAVPSGGYGGISKASENRPIPSIDRTISTLHRSRRFVNHIASDDYERFRGIPEYPTPYPKHHSLQPIPVPLGDFQPEEHLSTTAPYTENHHSWKKSADLFN